MNFFLTGTITPVEVAQERRYMHGAESSYDIPCEELFNQLGLVYASNDGDFINSKRELVVQKIPHSGGPMMKKKILMDYLNENGLDIIWTLLGEKMAVTQHGEQTYFGVPCGVFYFENGELKGELNHHERD